MPTIGGEKGKLGISRLSFVKKFEVFHNHLSLPQLDGDKKRDVSHNKKPGTCRRFFFDILHLPFRFLQEVTPELSSAMDAGCKRVSRHNPRLYLRKYEDVSIQTVKRLAAVDIGKTYRWEDAFFYQQITKSKIDK